MCNNIGEKIRECRKKCNLTIEEFAELLELSTTHIGNIERGKKMPTLKTFIKIINTLNVSSDTILMNSLELKDELKVKEIIKELEELSEVERKRTLDLFYYILESAKKFN